MKMENLHQLQLPDLCGEEEEIKMWTLLGSLPTGFQFLQQLLLPFQPHFQIPLL